MWNNQLSTVTSKKLIDYAQLHGINLLISDVGWYAAPNGEDFLPTKICSTTYERPVWPVSLFKPARRV